MKIQLQPGDLSSTKDSNMRKIDAFAHILPRSYLDRLERQLEKTMAPSLLDYYREGVFSFDPVLTDLDARWRKIEPYGDVDTALFGAPHVQGAFDLFTSRIPSAS